MNWYNPYLANHVHSSLIREQEAPISPTQDSLPRITPGSIQEQEVPKVKQKIKRSVPMNWYNPNFTNYVHHSLIQEQEAPISPTQDSLPRITPGSIQEQEVPKVKQKIKRSVPMNWYNPNFTNYVHHSLIQEQEAPISPTQDSLPRITPGSIQEQEVPKVKQKIKRSVPMNWYDPNFTNYVHHSLIQEQEVPISPTQDSLPRISPGSIQEQQVLKVKQKIKRSVPMNWYDPNFTNYVHHSLIQEQEVPISPTQDSLPRITPGSIH
ncbi:hypothetical protein AAHB57_30305 [Bacillus cereus]